VLHSNTHFVSLKLLLFDVGKMFNVHALQCDISWLFTSQHSFIMSRNNDTTMGFGGNRVFFNAMSKSNDVIFYNLK